MLLLKKLIYNTPVRYFAVTLCGFLVDFFVYAILVAVELSVYLANLLGFCVGATANVLLIRSFVFRESRHSLLIDVILTIIANGLVFFLGSLFLWIFVERMRSDPFIAKLIANGMTFSLNYVTRTYFFSRK